MANGDYEHTFAAAAGGACAEQWARAVFESPPRPVRVLLWGSWRFGLGLRLAPLNTPTAVLGWALVTSTPGEVVLTARSPLLDAVNRVTVHDGRLKWTTRVRYRNRFGALVWTLAKPLHHLLTPILLRRATRR